MEKYIEYSIIRKVFLCEQLYELSKINIKNSAEILDVTIPTVISDLEYLMECLEYCIESKKKRKNCFIVVFKQGIVLSELTQFLYNQSYVLKFLSHYFNGNFTSTILSDLEFISLSKVYNVKKIIFDLFKENGYLKENKIFIPEFDYRNIILALVRYIDWAGYEIRNQDVQKSIMRLINYVEENFFKRRYSKEEKNFIYRGIEIAIGRKKFPLEFNKKEKKRIEKKPLFILIAKGIFDEREYLELQEEDLYFIFSLFNTRNYTNQNMELLEKDVEVVYENFILKDDDYNELVELILSCVSSIDIDDLILKRSFLHFIRTIWADGQIFLPEKIYLLSKGEKVLYNIIIDILEEWKEKKNISVRWNKNLVRKFVKEVYLKTYYVENNNISEIFIVTENATKQIFYRKKLDIYIKNTIKVNSGIYHSLSELPHECFYSTKRLVLCDISKNHCDELEMKKTIIIPVSLQNIEFQLYNLKKYLIENNN